MSTLAIITLIVLAYIVQVLLMLAYPYYRYRKSYREHSRRTIGGLMNFTNATMGDGYMLIVLFPIAGIASFIIVTILLFIGAALRFFYNYIKDIKI